MENTNKCSKAPTGLHHYDIPEDGTDFEKLDCAHCGESMPPEQLEKAKAIAKELAAPKVAPDGSVSVPATPTQKPPGVSVPAGGTAPDGSVTVVARPGQVPVPPDGSTTVLVGAASTASTPPLDREQVAAALGPLKKLIQIRDELEKISIGYLTSAETGARLVHSYLLETVKVLIHPDIERMLGLLESEDSDDGKE